MYLRTAFFRIASSGASSSVKVTGAKGPTFLPSFITARSLAVTGRHSKNVAGKKNKLDAARTKLYTRMGVKILMVSSAASWCLLRVSL
jgi:hypothetical protein